MNANAEGCPDLVPSVRHPCDVHGSVEQVTNLSEPSPRAQEIKCVAVLGREDAILAEVRENRLGPEQRRARAPPRRDLQGGLAKDPGVR